MSVARVLVAAGYFGLVGYTIAKTELDKKAAKALKRGYGELVRYTSEVAGPVQVHVTHHTVAAIPGDTDTDAAADH